MSPEKQRKHILLGLLLVISNLIFVVATAQTELQPNADYIQFFNGTQVEECRDHNDFRLLYHSLGIYLDEDEEMSFEKIAKNQHLFQDNSTREKFEPNKTYWVKIDIQARKDKQDSIIFFMQDFSNLLGWDYIDAYLVHQDSTIDSQHTGFSVPKSKRTIDFPFIPVAFGLFPNERATLFFRLENNRQTIQSHYFKNRSEGLPHIKLLPTQIKNFSEYLEPYKFDGKYYRRSHVRPFRGNKIFQFDLLRDSSQQLDIADIYSNKDELPWAYYDTITADLDEVYWMKTKLIGTELFNGEHIFHVAPWIGAEGMAFEKIDVYIPDGQGNFSHQQTGHSIPMHKRPYDFWATFFTVDLQPNDSLDVFIRLEGMDPYSSMQNFSLFHIDPSSIFPKQNRIATKRFFFLGAMGIQFLIFFGLFFIERERIHFYFTLLILGQFLSFVFTPESYASYVLFPAWRQFEMPLLYFGSFLTSFGLLQFTATYFNYPGSSFFRKWIIPLFLIPFGLMCFYGFFPPQNIFYTQNIMLFSLLMLPIFFAMAIRAKGLPKSLKGLFILAFLPVSLAFIRIVGFNWTIFPQYDHLFHYEKVTLVLDWVSLGMVFTLWFLGLSIGFRNRLMKKEKALVEAQNAANKKIIFQKEIEAEQLQKIDELKTKLFTNITHEFRTPLTVIMGVNDELVNHSYIQELPESQRTRIEQNHKLISRNSKNLLNLISQLLDLSKADNGSMEVRLIQANIIPYLNYLTESFHSRANRKNIRLVFYSESEELLMDFDESKIQHIIYNLVSNALKFTNRDGKIIIHAKQENKQGQHFLKIIVNDNGIGISEEMLPHIFDRFYQVDHSNTREGEGTGIGLALVKELVELMQGQIEVTSVEGKGTTFTIALPITNQTPLVRHSEKEDPTILTMSSDVDAVEFEEEKALIDSEGLPLLLIVEDNDDVRQYITQILENNYQVISATNGAIGIEKAFKFTPDLIISDVMMPKVDGNILTNTLKKDKRTSHIPIVMLTAKSHSADKIEGIKSGADAFLIKPFDKEELLIRIEKLLELRKNLQSHYLSIASSLSVDSQIPSHPVVPAPENQFLQELKTFVNLHLDDFDLNVEKMCKALGMSHSQLHRKTTALTGVSPNKFIRIVRLNKAKVLLEQATNNVSEVAFALGFNDPSYFGRVFKKEFGLTPLEWKEKSSGTNN